MTPSGRNAFRPLNAAEEEIARLRRADSEPPEALREAVVRVTHAVEATLRRLLRDDAGADLELRLRALDPEELSADEVVADLRRRNVLPLEIAAGFHELVGVRARGRRGEPLGNPEASLALRVVDGIRRVGATPAAVSEPTVAELPPIPDDVTLLAPASLVPPASRRSSRAWMVPALLVLLALAGFFWWQRGGRGDGALAEGVSLFRSGDLPGARARFEAYSADHPEDATALLYLARIHRRAGRRAEAAAVLRRGLTAAPGDADLHRELGFLLLDTGRAIEAAERFRVAIQLNPEAPDAWIGLVRAHREAGRLDLAERVLEQAPAEVRARLVGAGVSAGSPSP